MSQNLNAIMQKIEYIPQLVVVNQAVNLTQAEFQELVTLCEERKLDFTSIETLTANIESMQYLDTGIKTILSTVASNQSKMDTVEKIVKAISNVNPEVFYIKLHSYLQQLISLTIMSELEEQKLEMLYNFVLVDPSTVRSTSVESIEKYISENTYFDIPMLEAVSFALVGSNQLKDVHDISSKAYELGFGVFCAKIKAQIHAVHLIKMPQYSEVINEEPGIFHNHSSVKIHNAWLSQDGRAWSPRVSYTPFGGLMKNSLKVVISVIVMSIFCLVTDYCVHTLIGWGGVIIKYKGDIGIL